MSQKVKRSLEGEGSDEDRIARFTDEMRVYLRRHLSEDEAALYVVSRMLDGSDEVLRHHPQRLNRPDVADGFDPW
jgi:hypothetical protein